MGLDALSTAFSFGARVYGLPRLQRVIRFFAFICSRSVPPPLNHGNILPSNIDGNHQPPVFSSWLPQQWHGVSGHQRHERDAGHQDPDDEAQDPVPARICQRRGDGSGRAVSRWILRIESGFRRENQLVNPRRLLILAAKQHAVVQRPRFCFESERSLPGVGTISCALELFADNREW